MDRTATFPHSHAIGRITRAETYAHLERNLGGNKRCASEKREQLAVGKS